MIQFYAPDIQTTLTLPESDSAHAVRVLRMQPGDELQAVDGRGHIFRCRLVEAHARHAVVEIVETLDSPLPWRQQIAVAVAPTKNMDRMEWLTEKLTEIGVNRIIPMLCDRSERRVVKTERLEKIAVSAMKQSLKAVCPVIDPLTPLAEVIGIMPGAQRFVGYCSDSVERTDMSRVCRPGADTLILIGPEGDFSPREIDAVIGAGILPVTFGDNRLRTETAALYAATIPHIIDSLSL